MFRRLRHNPAGHITMVLWASTAIPVDVFVGQMTWMESFAARIWFILIKFFLGGQYDRFRDWFREVSKPHMNDLIVSWHLKWLFDRMSEPVADRAKTAIIDAPLYAAFNALLNIVVIGGQVVWQYLVHGNNNLANGLTALVVITIGSFCFGPLFGVVLDSIKWLIEYFKSILQR